MSRFNVYFFSDWPESYGERIDVYNAVEFASEQEALTAANIQYGPIKFIVEVV